MKEQEENEEEERRKRRRRKKRRMRKWKMRWSEVGEVKMVHGGGRVDGKGRKRRGRRLDRATERVEGGEKGGEYKMKDEKEGEKNKNCTVHLSSPAWQPTQNMQSTELQI